MLTTWQVEGLTRPRMAVSGVRKPTRPCTGGGSGASGCGPSGDCGWSLGGDAAHV